MTDRIVIVCPTFNRRKFLPYLIYQFAYQTYNKNYLTLIILDDSETSNQDLFNTINDLELRSRIIYIHTTNKKTIGTKRNILNSIAKSLNPDYII
jgi:glycosyltransferase involved in cell wall biosynthesis